MAYNMTILKADQVDSNGEIIPREVLEQAVKEWNEKNDQIIELRHNSDNVCALIHDTFKVPEDITDGYESPKETEHKVIEIPTDDDDIGSPWRKHILEDYGNC